MFNKDGLGEMTETIVYVNLLVALLTVVLLYDRNRMEEEDQEEEQQHDRDLHDTIAALESRVIFLEQKLEEVLLELQRIG